ncbi:polysaccharide pyruvyl transferase family protein [Rhodocyclus tenuis]|uniref:Polysaccharide pyruvyl transferase domain-containing protein n=1 Tax=Rhodocyclus tenuis TaxID=1066 RepID=A0A840G7M2_RHOTE|nr:polysaccharide pyruvyl transferase family protein [Rhodocyclus tenuis]MBB4247876.1 hypothetical protein [Rhodocyclus tenuis]
MCGVALLGAFDRFNYGDLLFPVIAKREFAANSPLACVRTYALARSDLSRFGAEPTRSLRTLLQPGSLVEGDAVIFAGGGTIGAQWSAMHGNLLGRGGNVMLYYLHRLLGDDAVQALSRQRFGGCSALPWVIAPEDLPFPVPVAYNAVGASEVVNLSPELRSRTLETLGRASYVSVRDATSYALLAPVEAQAPLFMAPDSAVLMSEHFSVDWLAARASPALLARVDEAPYVCFQADVRYVRRHREAIVAALGEIYGRYGLPAALLPIGRYVGLEDQIALRELHARLKTPSFLVGGHASIWETMLVMAKASLFIGSSLHGAVTAQSFAVPHLGLDDPRRQKLGHYLATWDIAEQALCIAVHEMADLAGQALAVADEVRQSLRRHLIALSRRNFERMAGACAIAWA